MADPISIVALVIAAGSAVYSLTLDIPTPDSSDFGALVNKAGTDSTRDVVYGRCLTNATVLYKNVKDHERDIRLDIFSCGIAVSAIHQVLIDDVEALANEGDYRETTDTNSLRFSGNQLKNNFNKQCQIQLRTGWPINAPLHNGLPIGTPMQLAMDNSDGEWTDKARGDYTCMVAVTSKRITDDEEVRILGSQFKMSLEVSGARVFDPRFGSDTNVKQYKHLSGVPAENVECGRNPALCLLDYITNTYYGMKISYDFINLESFKLAANWCDKRKFKVDGQLNQGNTFAKNINALSKSAGLHPVIINGELHCLFEDAGVASHHFNNDNIIKNTIKVKEQSSNEYINAVEVDYKNSELLDEKDTFILPQNLYPNATEEDYPSQVQKDGFLNQGSVELSMVRMNGSDVNRADSQVRYFANRELQKQQYQKEITFDIDLDNDSVNLFDIISVTNEEYGWDKKEFRILSIKPRFNDEEYNTATINCKEHNNNIYKGTGFGTPGSSKPVEKKDVTSPTNLSFNQYNTGKNSGARLSWTRTYFETSSTFVVEYKKSSVTSWTHLGKTEATSWDFPLLASDSYDFRVATYSNLYGMSTFTVLTNQEISSFGTFPTVSNVTSIFTGQNCIFTWDDMLDKEVILPANPDPSAPSNPKVRDYFSHYQVDIFHKGIYKRSVDVVGSNYFYTFDDNLEDGLSREVTAEVYIVGDDGTKSQIGTTSEKTAINHQHIALGGFSQRGGQLSAITLQWDLSSEPDYHSTIIRRKKGANGEYEFIKVTGSFFADTLPESDAVGTTYYYNVAARDVFDDDNLNWSSEVVVKKTTIGDLLPNFHDELGDIRNPDYQSNPNELIFNVSNTNRDKIAGLGLYAPEDATENSKFIVAADEFVISAGGHAEYDKEKSYKVGERATISLTPEVQRLYEARRDNTNKYPTTNVDDWELILENTYQSAFYFDAIAGKLVLNSAVINEIDAGSITTGTLDADRIQANSITGDKINATSTITIGNQRDPDIIGTMGEERDVLEKELSVFSGYARNTNNGVNYYGYADGTGLFVNVFFPMGEMADINLYNNKIVLIQTLDGEGGDVESRSTKMTFDANFGNPSSSYNDSLDDIPDSFVLHASNGNRCVFNKAAPDPIIGKSIDWVSNETLFTETDLESEVKIYVHTDITIELLEDFVRSTDPLVIINGDDSEGNDYRDYRIVAGHVDPNLANFSVDRFGVVKAKDAVIEGKIRAHSGEFSGTLTTAKFKGAEIDGTNMSANVFKAGMIIASTIYAAESEILVDPDDDPTTIHYYDDSPSIPVSAMPIVESATKGNLSHYQQWHNFDLLSAADFSGEPSQKRARYLTIPQNTMTLSIEPYYCQTDYYQNNFVPEDLSVYIELIGRDGTKKAGATGVLDLQYKKTGITYDLDIPVAGVNFHVSAAIDIGVAASGIIQNGHASHYIRIRRFNVYNTESDFGSVYNDALNGYFRISVVLPRMSYYADNKKGGGLFYIDDIYNAELTTNVYLDNQ